MNKCVIDYVQKIVKLFNLDWVVNIQLKLSPDNKPLIYEINPRLAGSVILTKGANCDLLKYGLDVISNRELKINSPKSCKMIRYYTEVLV
jgi:carbamoylphosphate synthase large subunit